MKRDVTIQTEVLLEEEMYGRTLESVPLDKLPPNEFILGSDPGEAFINSVATHGILQPPAIGLRDGQTSIIWGRRRIKAARLLHQLRPMDPNFESIWCWVYTGNWQEWADELTLQENEQRATNVMVEVAKIESMLKRGMSIGAIREHTGMRRGTINERITYTNLLGPLRTGWHEGKIKQGVAKAAARLSQQRQIPLAAILKEKGSLTMDDIVGVKTVHAPAVQGDFLAAIPTSTDISWEDRVRKALYDALDEAPDNWEHYQTLQRVLEDLS